MVYSNQDLFKIVSLGLHKSLQTHCFVFLAVLGLCCCARAFSSCGKRGLVFVSVPGLLIAVTSLVVEHGL